MPEKVLLATVKNNFSGYEPSRKKLRASKKHAIEDVYGTCEGSYNDLPNLKKNTVVF